MDDPAGVPSGLSGVLGDFAHYCRVLGAKTLCDKLSLPFRAPALVALATYRFGRWVYTSPRLNRPTSLPFRAVFAGMSEVVRHATGVLIHPWSEIERDVWFASFAPIIVGARRIRAGSMIHGGVTLGAGGARGARGVPIIGSNVTVGPGAAIVGPVDVPDGSVIGPNTLLTSSPAKASTWLGSPAMKSKRSTGSMLPAELL
jgi:serine O-acetyltransferase